MGVLIGLVLIIFGIVLAIYIAFGVFLNKLNKLMYGKGTALAFIPVCNTYLLGKLSVDSKVGWGLVIADLLISDLKLTFNGTEKTLSILPAGLKTVVSLAISIVTIVLLVKAIKKYKELKNKPVTTEEVVNNQIEQPVQNVEAPATRESVVTENVDTPVVDQNNTNNMM